MKTIALGLGLLVCGCVSNDIDAGGHDAGAMGKPGPTDESCENGPQSPMVGSWTGYVENQKWASGSDVIHIVIANANDSLACGTVSLGDAPPPPPATDPNVGYPPGAFDPVRYSGSSSGGTFIENTEGFVWPMAQPKVTGSRLQFQVRWTATWDAWCALQTPVVSWSSLRDINGNVIPSYTCLDEGVTDDTGCHAHDGSLVDCGRYTLCSGTMCTCTADGCQPWNANCDTLDFDMQVAADVATGSVALGCLGVHNVHFSKDR